jgi:hypothetical protein
MGHLEPSGPQGSTKHNPLSKQEWLLSKGLEQQNSETSTKIGMKQAEKG